MTEFRYNKRWDVLPYDETTKSIWGNTSVYNEDNDAEWWRVIDLPEGPLMMDNINGEMAIIRSRNVLVTVF